MDDYMARKHAFWKRKRRYDVVAAITNQNSIPSSEDKRASRLLTGPMSTILEETFTPQIREINQSVNELLYNFNRKFSSCDFIYDSNHTIAAASSISSKDSVVSHSSDPSATSHDVESITFCSSRKSHSFHFTMAKNADSDMIDLEIPKLSHHNCKSRKAATFVANVLTKKSFSNSNIYDQPYAIIPIKFGKHKSRPIKCGSATKQHKIHIAEEAIEDKERLNKEKKRHSRQAEKHIKHRHMGKKHSPENYAAENELYMMLHSFLRKNLDLSGNVVCDAGDNNKEKKKRKKNNGIHGNIENDDQLRIHLEDQAEKGRTKSPKLPRRSEIRAKEKLREHKHKDHGDLPEDPEIHINYLIADQETKEERTKRKKYKGIEKLEADVLKKPRRQNSFIRIKHSIMQLAGLGKTSERKKSKSRKRSKSRDKPILDIHEQALAGPSFIAEHKQAKCTHKDKKVSQMQQFLKHDIVDLQNIYTHSSLPAEKKPRPTITLAELGSLTIPPFQQNKNAKKERKQKGHLVKEAKDIPAPSRFQDTGTMPASGLCRDEQTLCDGVEWNSALTGEVLQHNVSVVADINMDVPRPVTPADQKGTIISCHDLHDTTQIWKTSLSSFEEMSNVVIISGFESAEEKSAILESREHAIKKIQQMKGSNYHQNQFQQIVESLYMRPMFHSCSGISNLDNRKIKNKSINTDFVWGDDRLNIQYYKHGIRKLKPQRSRTRKTVFKKFYNTKFVNLNRRHKPYQYMTQYSDATIDEPDTSINSKSTKKSRIPVFYHEKSREKVKHAQTYAHYSELSCTVDSEGREKMRSRIPKPKFARNLRTMRRANNTEEKSVRIITPSMIFDGLQIPDAEFGIPLGKQKEIVILDNEIIEFITDSETEFKSEPNQTFMSETVAHSTTMEDNSIVDITCTWNGFEDLMAQKDAASSNLSDFTNIEPVETLIIPESGPQMKTTLAIDEPLLIQSSINTEEVKVIYTKNRDLTNIKPGAGNADANKALASGKLDKLDKLRRLETNTTIIVSLADCVVSPMHEERKQQLRLQDEICVIASRINMTECIQTSIDPDQQSVSLQVLMPMKHVDTNTSNTTMTTFSRVSRRSHLKSHLPLRIDRPPKLPLAQTYTFPVQIDLNRLNDRQTGGESVKYCRQTNSRSAKIANYPDCLRQNINSLYFRSKLHAEAIRMRSSKQHKPFYKRWWSALRNKKTKIQKTLVDSFHWKSKSEEWSIENQMRPEMGMLEFTTTDMSTRSSKNDFNILCYKSNARNRANYKVGHFDTDIESHQASNLKVKTKIKSRRKKTTPENKRKSVDEDMSLEENLMELNQSSGQIIFDIPAMAKHEHSGSIALKAREEVQDQNMNEHEDVLGVINLSIADAIRERDRLVSMGKGEVDKNLKELKKQAEEKRGDFHYIFTPIVRGEYGLTYYNFCSPLRNYDLNKENLKILTPCVKGQMEKAPKVQITRDTSIDPILTMVPSHDCAKHIAEIGKYFFPDEETARQLDENEPEAPPQRKNVIGLQKKNLVLFEIYPWYAIEEEKEARIVEAPPPCGSSCEALPPCARPNGPFSVPHPDIPFPVPKSAEEINEFQSATKLEGIVPPYLPCPRYLQPDAQSKIGDPQSAPRVRPCRRLVEPQGPDEDIRFRPCQHQEEEIKPIPKDSIPKRIQCPHRKGQLFPKSAQQEPAKPKEASKKERCLCPGKIQSPVFCKGVSVVPLKHTHKNHQEVTPYRNIIKHLVKARVDKLDPPPCCNRSEPLNVTKEPSWGQCSCSPSKPRDARTCKMGTPSKSSEAKNSFKRVLSKIGSLHSFIPRFASFGKSLPRETHESAPCSGKKQIDASCVCEMCLCDFEDEDYVLTLNLRRTYHDLVVAFPGHQFKLILTRKLSPKRSYCGVEESSSLNQLFFETLYDRLCKNGEFLRKVRKVLAHPTPELLGVGEDRQLALSFITDLMNSIVSFDGMYVMDAAKIYFMEIKYRRECFKDANIQVTKSAEFEIDNDCMFEFETLQPAVNEDKQMQYDSKDRQSARIETQLQCVCKATEAIRDMKNSDSETQISSEIIGERKSLGVVARFPTNRNGSEPLKQTSYRNLFTHCSNSCSCMQNSSSIQRTVQGKVKTSKSCTSISPRLEAIRTREAFENAAGDGKRESSQARIVASRIRYLCEIQHQKQHKSLYAKKSSSEFEHLYNSCECFIPPPICHYHYACDEIIVRHPPVLWVLAKKMLTRSNIGADRKRRRTMPKCTKCSKLRKRRNMPSRRLEQNALSTDEELDEQDTETGNLESNVEGKSNSYPAKNTDSQSRFPKPKSSEMSSSKVQSEPSLIAPDYYNEEIKTTSSCSSICPGNIRHQHSKPPEHPPKQQQNRKEYRKYSQQNSMCLCKPQQVKQICTSTPKRNWHWRKKKQSKKGVLKEYILCKNSSSVCQAKKQAKNANRDAETMPTSKCLCSIDQPKLQLKKLNKKTHNEFCVAPKQSSDPTSAINDDQKSKLGTMDTQGQNDAPTKNETKNTNQQSDNSNEDNAQNERKESDQYMGSDNRPYSDTKNGQDNTEDMENNTESRYGNEDEHHDSKENVQPNRQSVHQKGHDSKRKFGQSLFHNKTIETMTITHNQPMVSMTVLTDSTTMKDEASATSSWINNEMQTLLTFKPSRIKRSSWIRRTFNAFRKSQVKSNPKITRKRADLLNPGFAQTSITLVPTEAFPNSLFGSTRYASKKIDSPELYLIAKSSKDTSTIKLQPAEIVDKETQDYTFDDMLRKTEMQPDTSMKSAPTDAAIDIQSLNFHTSTLRNLAITRLSSLEGMPGEDDEVEKVQKSILSATKSIEEYNRQSGLSPFNRDATNSDLDVANQVIQKPNAAIQLMNVHYVQTENSNTNIPNQSTQIHVAVSKIRVQETSPFSEDIRSIGLRSISKSTYVDERFDMLALKTRTKESIGSQSTNVHKQIAKEDSTLEPLTGALIIQKQVAKSQLHESVDTTNFTNIGTKTSPSSETSQDISRSDYRCILRKRTDQVDNEQMLIVSQTLLQATKEVATVYVESDVIIIRDDGQETNKQTKMVGKITQKSLHTPAVPTRERLYLNQDKGEQISIINQDIKCVQFPERIGKSDLKSYIPIPVSLCTQKKNDKDHKLQISDSNASDSLLRTDMSFCKYKTLVESPDSAITIDKVRMEVTGMLNDEYLIPECAKNIGKPKSSICPSDKRSHAKKKSSKAVSGNKKPQDEHIKGIEGGRKPSVDKMSGPLNVNRKIKEGTKMDQKKSRYLKSTQSNTSADIFSMKQKPSKLPGSKHKLCAYCVRKRRNSGCPQRLLQETISSNIHKSQCLEDTQRKTQDNGEIMKKGSHNRLQDLSETNICCGPDIAKAYKKLGLQNLKKKYPLCCRSCNEDSSIGSMQKNYSGKSVQLDPPIRTTEMPSASSAGLLATVDSKKCAIRSKNSDHNEAWNSVGTKFTIDSTLPSTSKSSTTLYFRKHCSDEMSKEVDKLVHKEFIHMYPKCKKAKKKISRMTASGIKYCSRCKKGKRQKRSNLLCKEGNDQLTQDDVEEKLLTEVFPKRCWPIKERKGHVDDDDLQFSSHPSNIEPVPNEDSEVISSQKKMKQEHEISIEENHNQVFLQHNFSSCSLGCKPPPPNMNDTSQAAMYTHFQTKEQTGIRDKPGSPIPDTSTKLTKPRDFVGNPNDYQTITQQAAIVPSFASVDCQVTIPRKMHIKMKNIVPSIRKKSTKILRNIPNLVKSSPKEARNKRKKRPLAQEHFLEKPIDILSTVEYTRYGNLNDKDRFSRSQRKYPKTAPEYRRNINYLESVEISYEPSTIKQQLPTTKTEETESNDKGIDRRSNSSTSSSELNDALSSHESYLIDKQPDSTPSMIPVFDELWNNGTDNTENKSRRGKYAWKNFLSWVKALLHTDKHVTKEGSVRKGRNKIVCPRGLRNALRRNGNPGRNARSQGELHIRESHYRRTFKCGCTAADDRPSTGSGKPPNTCECKGKHIVKVANPKMMHYSFVDFSQIYTNNSGASSHTSNSTSVRINGKHLVQTEYSQIFEIARPALENTEGQENVNATSHLNDHDDHEITFDSVTFQDEIYLGETYATKNRLSTIVEHTEHDIEHDHSTEKLKTEDNTADKLEGLVLDKDEDEHSIAGDVAEIINMYKRMHKQSRKSQHYMGERLPNVPMKSENIEKCNNLFDVMFHDQDNQTMPNPAFSSGIRGNVVSRALEAFNKKMKMSLGKVRHKNWRSEKSPHSEVPGFSQTSKSEVTEKVNDVQLGEVSYVIRASRYTKAEQRHSQRTINSDISSLKSHDDNSKQYSHLLSTCSSHQRVAILKEMLLKNQPDRAPKTQNEFKWINQEIADKYRVDPTTSDNSRLEYSTAASHSGKSKAAKYTAHSSMSPEICETVSHHLYNRSLHPTPKVSFMAIRDPLCDSHKDQSDHDHISREHRLRRRQAVPNLWRKLTQNSEDESSTPKKHGKVALFRKREKCKNKKKVQIVDYKGRLIPQARRKYTHLQLSSENPSSHSFMPTTTIQVSRSASPGTQSDLSKRKLQFFEKAIGYQKPSNFNEGRVEIDANEEQQVRKRIETIPYNHSTARNKTEKFININKILVPSSFAKIEKPTFLLQKGIKSRANSDLTSPNDFTTCSTTPREIVRLRLDSQKLDVLGNIDAHASEVDEECQQATDPEYKLSAHELRSSIGVSCFTKPSFDLEKLSATSYPEEREYILNTHEYDASQSIESSSQRKVILCTSKNLSRNSVHLSKPKLLLASNLQQCKSKPTSTNIHCYRNGKFDVESHSSYDLHIPHTASMRDIPSRKSSSDKFHHN